MISISGNGYARRTAPPETGAATYTKGMPRVRLLRSSMPTLPASAATNSGRCAWFSIVLGSASESASTLPVGSITVARAPAAWPSCAVMSASEFCPPASTRWANIRVFLFEIALDLLAQRAFPDPVHGQLQRDRGGANHQQKHEHQFNEDAASQRATSKR